MAKANSSTLVEEYVEKYEYRLNYSEEEGEYFATIAEFPHISVFADKQEDALSEAKEVVEDILNHCMERDIPIPTPQCKKEYSGKFIVRIPTSLHRRLAQEAESQHATLNSFVSCILAGHFSRKPS